MFDAGGYHLKSVDGMNGMKYDMCGAAEMMEILEYLAIQKVEKNVMAVLMLAENVISPDAVKMGDVITTLAGKTVESTTPMRKDGWYCVTVSRLRSVWGRAP